MCLTLADYNSFLGVEVVGEEKLVITNDAMCFLWEDHGLKLHVPKNALPEGISEYPVGIKVSLTGQFKLPEGHELVSAVYWVATPGKLQSQSQLKFNIVASLKVAVNYILFAQAVPRSPFHTSLKS